MALSKAKFTFGSSFRETLSEAKSRLLINFLPCTLLPGHLQCVHGIFLVYSAIVDVNWQDNRCDTKSDVIAVLLGGLICQWNLQITFRSNTSEHTWQLLFCHWTLLGVYQLDRTDIRCLSAPKESSFSISFIPRQGWATTSELNFLIEHLKNVVWESRFSMLSITNQAKHQSRCGIPYCHGLMYIYTVS